MRLGSGAPTAVSVPPSVVAADARRHEERRAARAEPERVTRAAGDALRLAVAAVLLLVTALLGWLFDATLVDNAAGVLRGLDTVSATVVALTVSIAEVLTLLLVIGGLVVAVYRRAWLLIASSAVAMAIAAGLVGLLDHLFAAKVQVTNVDDSLALIGPGRLVTAEALAAMTAFVTVAGPWISRRWRRAAWTVVILVTGVRFVAAEVSFDTIVALLSGWMVGAGAVLGFGAPSRRPTPSAIGDGLAAVGVPLADIEPLSVDARGSTPYLASSADGRHLFVKALGTDERSADLMFRIFRALQPRNLADERPFSSLRRMVEHEALVALAARDAAVRTPRFVAFAEADPNGYVLAYEAIDGRSLDRLEPAEMTDDVLRSTWEQLAILRRHRIAHRDLRLANVFLDDAGEVWIIDFGFAELSASDTLLANDLAELLASSSTCVGAARALAAGRGAVGHDALVTALDRLQLPMLSGATREAMKASPGALDELRALLESPPRDLSPA